MKLFKFLFLLLIPLGSGAQSISGIIYDDTATIKGAKFLNTTQNILSYSDDKGVFQIEAKLNDSIVVSSYFHYEKTIIVNSDHFGKDIVIELKKITTELDEVEVVKVNEKVFDSSAIRQTTAGQGQIAFKPRVFGSGKNLQPTLDVLQLARVIGKLFKKKTLNTPKIVTSDFINLFETHPFFNSKMLREELGIPEAYEHLFFEYLEVQYLDASLLNKLNEFMLLDELLKLSKAFNQLLLEHKKD